jgi:hypothetical protein
MTAPKTRAAVHSILKKQGAKTGGLCDAFARHDRDLLHWIIEQTPKGSTVSDTVLAIALDAFYDEKSPD